MPAPPPPSTDTRPTPLLPLRHLSLRTAWALVLGGALLALVLVAAGFAALHRLARTTPVTVVEDGQPRTLNTRAATVGALLHDLHLDLAAADAVSAAPNTRLTPGFTLTIRRARPVVVSVDDTPRTLWTTADTAEAILAEAGVTLGPHDALLVDGAPSDGDDGDHAAVPTPPTRLTVRRARNVTLEQAGSPPRTWQTTAATVGEALEQANLTLYLADDIRPPLDAPLTAPHTTIVMVSARALTIVADGARLPIRSRAATVGEALAEAGVGLYGLDYAIPDEQSPVVEGMQVRVIRVREAVISTRETLPFPTQDQPEPSLEIDQTRLVQPGRDGLRRTDVRVRYENGVEIARSTEASVLVRAPQPRIVAYGTGVVLRTVSTEDGPRTYWRKLRMYATSYHPAALGGDDITATGRRLTIGIVAVDPTVIPYGTWVYVPGYGLGLAADTGGPRRFRRWIDLGYDDHNFRIWARWADVYILTPVPASIDYVLPE